MAPTTTVRIDHETRERLRRVEERLGVTTVEALRRAVDALDADLFWDDVHRYYAENPATPAEDQAWLDQVARAQG
jgi:hypothetical protein